MGSIIPKVKQALRAPEGVQAGTLTIQINIVPFSISLPEEAGVNDMLLGQAGAAIFSPLAQSRMSAGATRPVAGRLRAVPSSRLPMSSEWARGLVTAKRSPQTVSKIGLSAARRIYK